MAEILLQAQKVFVDRFQFQLSDLNIEFNQCLFECLDACGGTINGVVYIGEVGRAVLGGTAGNLVYDLVPKIMADRVDALKYARCLPMEAEDLDLAVDAFCNRDDRLMEGGPCNGKLFVETIEEV